MSNFINQYIKRKFSKLEAGIIAECARKNRYGEEMTDEEKKIVELSLLWHEAKHKLRQSRWTPAEGAYQQAVDEFVSVDHRYKKLMKSIVARFSPKLG